MRRAALRGLLAAHGVQAVVDVGVVGAVGAVEAVEEVQTVGAVEAAYAAAVTCLADAQEGVRCTAQQLVATLAATHPAMRLNGAGDWGGLDILIG